MSYKIINTISVNVSDSYVYNAIKSSKTTANGEAKLHIGSESNKNFYDTFFANQEIKIFRKDLISYLQQVRLAYQCQIFGGYRNCDYAYWIEKIKETLNYEDVIIINEEIPSFISNKRYYIRLNNDFFKKYFRSIILPFITEIRFDLIEDSGHKYLQVKPILKNEINDLLDLKTLNFTENLDNKFKIFIFYKGQELNLDYNILIENFNKNKYYINNILINEKDEVKEIYNLDDDDFNTLNFYIVNSEKVFSANPKLKEKIPKLKDFIELLKLFYDSKDEYEENKKNFEILDNKTINPIKNVIQEIVYGAPGTGKSYYINENIKQYSDNIERVTFYDGYSYNNFIGSYKPSANKENITYEFVPGPFFRILEKAYKNQNTNYYLVIEEINRGCADKIFGNIFQLLDRKDTGESMYPISLLEEQDTYLKNTLATFYDETILKHKGLYLPSNLSIYATMNSGDQNVYPLDAAFKRRWNFKYIGLNENKNKFGIPENNYTIKLGSDLTTTWEKFRYTINSILLNNNIREDRLIAPFFINPKEFIKDLNLANNFILNEDVFKNKILMYLYEDVLRYTNKNIIFSEEIKSFSHLLEVFSNNEIMIFNENFYTAINEEI